MFAVTKAKRFSGGISPGELAGLAERVRPTAEARTRLVPVEPPLAPLLPEGGLRRGGVVQCAGGAGLSLALALAGRASAGGAWCGFVGLSELGVLAAIGYGIEPGRIALIEAGSAEWPVAVGELMGGFEVVVLRPRGRAREAVIRQLVARARREGAVLLVVGGAEVWPGSAEIRLEVLPGEWHGLDQGSGYLRARRVTVRSYLHGPGGRPVERELWLPSATGAVAAA